MTQYKKILLIDADAILLNNVDSLFDLKAPAAPFMYNVFAKFDGETYTIRDTYKIDNIPIGEDGTFKHGH